MKTYLCGPLRGAEGSLVTIRAGGRRFFASVKSSGFETKIVNEEGEPEDYPGSSRFSRLYRTDHPYENLFLEGYDKDTTVYQQDKQTREITKSTSYPKGISTLTEKWLFFASTKSKKQGRTTKIVNRKDQSTFTLPYHFEFEFECGGTEVIAKIGGGETLFDECLARIDPSTQEIIWRNSDIMSFGHIAGTDSFQAKAKNDRALLGLYSLDTGEKLRDFESLGSANVRYDKPGSLHGCNTRTGVFTSYDIAEDLESDWKIFQISEGGEGFDIEVAGDEVIVFDMEKGRLYTYDLITHEKLTDHPIKPPTEKHGSIYKTDGGYMFVTAAPDLEYDGTGLHRAWVFTLDELDGTDWKIEHEQFLCTHERMPREDGDVDYRVYFPEPQSLAALYRQIACYAHSLGSILGINACGVDENTDKQWTGLLKIDLRNQTLDERARLEISTVCMFVVQGFNENWFTARAGIDIEEPILIEPIFNDE